MLGLDGYRSFFELSLDLFMMADFNGIIVATNNAWKATLGYDQGELIGQPLMKFIYTADKNATESRLHHSTQGFDIHHFENRWVAKDGSLHWVRWTSRVDYENRLIFGVGVDFTERRTKDELLAKASHDLEAALKEETQAKKQGDLHRERLYSLFMQAPAIVGILKGPSHVCEFANAGWMRLMGNRDIVGKPLAEYLPDLDSSIRCVLDQVYSTGERFVGKGTAIRADWCGNGKPQDRYFDFVYEPTFSAGGEVEGICVWTVDVTEQLQMQRQLRIDDRMAGIGRLAAGIAHEINNPLAYALGNIELTLQNLALNSSAKDNLAKAIDGLERVVAIVKGLKAFSRVDDVKLEVVDVVAEIESAVSITAHEVRHARAEIELDTGVGLKTRAPRGALCKIIMNLIVNSSHAVVGRDRRKIRVSAHQTSDAEATLIVEDSGCGMTDAQLETLFEPFITTKEPGHGTGLGLSIVHGLVSSLKGTIEVSSQPGRGTTFRILFPLDETNDSTEKAGPCGELSQIASACPTTRRNIIVVDDEPELREVLREGLSEHCVESFGRIHDVMKRIESRGCPVDLILCDLTLDGESGRDLYEALKARAPGMEKKIIFITGGATEEDLAKWLESIPNQVMMKPFRLRELRKLIGTEINHAA